jgi:hypothetical protein
VRLVRFGNLKNKSMNSWGIETATFRFIGQCLNQLCYRVPRSKGLKELLKGDVYLSDLCSVMGVNTVVDLK